MHQILFIREILFNIFGHCSPPDCHNAHLVALARTCRTFTEPALDVLWEELPNLSPLARCLPGAYFKSTTWSYAFRRPLTEPEWNSLRGYARRVWSIRGLSRLHNSAIEILFTSGPALFPNLRSLLWERSTILPGVHTAVLSLTSLHLCLSLTNRPLQTEFLSAIGEHCPNMRSFGVFSPPLGLLDVLISRQLCLWTNIQLFRCPQVALSMDTILRLPSTSTLTLLSCTLSADLDSRITHLGSVSIFSNLSNLAISSASLKSITNLFSCIRLPKIRDLSVDTSEYTSRHDVSEYWITVQRACTSSTLASLTFFSSDDGITNWANLDEQRRPCLTLDDLLPYKDFGNLYRININIAWSVKLTDADLLDLVSTSPRLEELSINATWGWRIDGHGGITLGGLVQLLRQCPFLDYVVLAIDTRTFFQIPPGLEVSFPPRKGLFLNYLDSYVARELGPDLKSVFEMLGLDDWASFRGTW